VETHLSRAVALSLLADLVCVLAFAFGGKSSHEASEPSWVVLVIAWPFALSALIAHIGLFGRDRQSTAVWPSGVVVVAVTYLLGMTLRVIEGRGIAVGFLVVALLFLSVTMLGWRAVAERVRRGPEQPMTAGERR
jgi:hypothetical protein